jgi:hypothetical protein
LAQKRAFLYSIVCLAALLAAPGTRQAAAAPALDVSTNQAALQFPETITFRLGVSASTQVSSIVLEYGDVEETCGQVTARAYPQFTASGAVTTEWTWDMRQSSSLPPGAQVWWRWHITDQSGNETITDRKTETWLDSTHPWDTLQKGDVRLHWYGNSRDFAQQLLDAADSGLVRLERDAGLSNDRPIDLYIYPNNQDMQDAILYEPGWTGGMAFPQQSIVIIGIPTSELEWGKSTEVHEMTHVLVGHFTFTCLGDVPTWLNEGLAVYSEVPLVSASQSQLDEAVRSNTLLPVRSLSGPFSEVSSMATLSYTESYSLVKFLIDGHGRDKMNALLLALRDGNTIDQALGSVYGFDVEGLEDAWRTSIGAQARIAQANPTARPAPTFVPTIRPISGALPAITPTAVVRPTPVPTQAGRTTPPLSLTVTLLCTCLAVGVVLAVMVLGFIMASKRKETDSAPRP